LRLASQRPVALFMELQHVFPELIEEGCELVADLFTAPRLRTWIRWRGYERYACDYRRAVND
jgi:hypothetical protein